MEKIKCPCCNYYTINEIYDICPVCFWENDPIQEVHPNTMLGANHVTLNVAKENYKKFGVSELEYADKVRDAKYFENG